MWWIRIRTIEASAASSTKAIERAGISNRPDRERAAVDVEMAERVHEILEEERRAGHEHEQRQLRVVEAERAPEQLYEQPERDQPDRAGRARTPATPAPCREQRHHRADQRALGEAEMIIDQQMDVGNVGRQRDLVEKHPDQHGDVDGEHQAPGVFPTRRFIRAPEVRLEHDGKAERSLQPLRHPEAATRPSRARARIHHLRGCALAPRMRI